MRYQCRCLARVVVRGLPPRVRASGHVYRPTTKPCGARRSLRRKPAQYIQQPQCPQCGARNWGLDRYRIRRELRIQEKCYCSGYPEMASKGVPHRKGSRECDFHPDNAHRYE